MSNERGTTALLVAASLTLLLGVAAIAIDGGRGMSERRQAQAAVDFGALAALQFARSCNPCNITDAANAGAAEAILVVSQNLPDQTSLNWNDPSCDLSRPPAYTVVATSTPCVSFTANLSRSRVSLPGAVLDTSFGRVIGFNSITVRNQAEAELTIEASSVIVPFPHAGGTDTCLYSNQAPQTVPPCDGPNDGNFGYLDITLFGNTAMGTTTDCSNASIGRLAVNIALGTDHSMGVWSSGDPLVNDHDACPNTNETVNQLETSPGSPSKPITEGLITDPMARLRCDSEPCRDVRGLSLDDQPLWDHLVSGKCPGANTRDTMITCLEEWTSDDGVIFEPSIANSKRFAAVPVFASYPETGFGEHTIVDFYPVYLETIYVDCNANSCDTVFSPGENPAAACDTLQDDTVLCGLSSGSWGDGTRVQGLTALTIDLGMLPESIAEFFPGQPGTRNYALYK